MRLEQVKTLSNTLNQLGQEGSNLIDDISMEYQEKLDDLLVLLTDGKREAQEEREKARDIAKEKKKEILESTPKLELPKLESALVYSAWATVAWKIYGETVNRDVLDNKARLKLGLIRSISHKYTQETVQLMEEPLDIIYKVAEILGSPSALTMEINRLLDLLEPPKARKDMVSNCILSSTTLV